MWKVSYGQVVFQYSPVRILLNFGCCIVILATFLHYMKDFISLIKTAGSNMCSNIFQPCLKEKESEVETDMTIGTAEAEENFGNISHFTVSGIFNLIVSFYQIKQLISVDVQSRKANDFSFITFISIFF